MLLGVLSGTTFIAPIAIESLWPKGSTSWVVLIFWYTLPIVLAVAGLMYGLYLLSKYAPQTNAPLVIFGMFLCTVAVTIEGVIVAILANGGV
jgi:hypothetical protein